MACLPDRRLHRGHDLAGLGADHREAENAVTRASTSTFMKPCVFVDRSRPQHGAHRQLGHPHRDALALGFAFVQANPSEGGSVNMQ